jgi:excisionase family DNA binding protein
MKDHDEILTLSEVAFRLRCSKAHVSKAINGRLRDLPPLPAIRMGRRRLVRRSSLERWLASNEHPAHSSAILTQLSNVRAVNA